MTAGETSRIDEQKPVSVLFLCRGSLDNGIGHVTRARTVAKAMNSSGCVTLAAIGDDYVDNLLMNHGLDYRVLPNDSDVMPFVRETAPDIVIFDLTHFDPAEFAAIAAECMTVSLSPVFNCLAQVDLFFHRTVNMDAAWSFAEDKPLVRRGLSYAIVSDHCRRIEEEMYWKNVKTPAMSIAITMGGTDASNKTLRVLETIKSLPDPLLIWVLLGEGYSHSYESLADSIRGSKHEVIMARTNASMWRILDACALAIVAGGTTTYEAAYAGLPSINMLERPQQYFLIQELVDRGACLCAGNTFPESLANLNPILTSVSSNRESLFAMHLRSQGLIDGQAASRVADEVLCAYYKRKYRHAKHS